MLVAHVLEDVTDGEVAPDRHNYLERVDGIPDTIQRFWFSHDFVSVNLNCGRYEVEHLGNENPNDQTWHIFPQLDVAKKHK